MAVWFRDNDLSESTLHINVGTSNNDNVGSL